MANELTFDDLPDASTPAGGQQPGDLVVHRPDMKTPAGMFDDLPSAAAPRVAREAEPTREQKVQAMAEQERGARDRQNPVLRYGDTLMRGIARGVPFADDMSAAGDTLTQNIAAPFTGVPAQSFTENKDRQRAKDMADDQDRPVTSYGGQIAGGIMLPVPPVAKGASMVDQIGHGVVTGLGMGAAYGAGEGDTLDERLQNAGSGAIVGGLAGGAAPVATGALSKGASWLYGHTLGPVINHFRAPGAAEDRVARAVASDANSPMDKIGRADLPASITDGQPIAVGDLGAENTRSLARATKNTSPDAAASLQALTKGRADEQAGRYTDKIGSMFGGDLNSTTLNDQLQARAAAANKVNYDAAHAAPGARSLWNTDLQQITNSPAVRTAMQGVNKKAKDVAVMEGYRPVQDPFTFGADGQMRIRATQRADGTIENATPNLAYWDMVKRGLDDQISSAGFGSDQARVLRGIKKQLTDHLDNAVPEYATARSGAAKAFGAEDALEAGRNFATGQNKAMDFTDAQKAVGKMSAPERELFARGYAAELQGKANGPAARSDLSAGSTFDSPAQRAKAQLALGPQRADSLEAFTRREQIMQGLKGAVSGNSTTAKQLMELGLVGAGTGGVEMWHKGELSMPGLAGAAAAGLGAMAVIHGGNKLNANITREVGQILSSTDPDTVRRILAKSENRGAVLDAMRKLNTYVQPAISGTAAQAGSKAVANDGAGLGESGAVPVDGSMVAQPFAAGGAVGEGVVQQPDTQNRNNEQAVNDKNASGGQQAPKAQGHDHRDHLVSSSPSRTTSGNTDFMRNLVGAIASRRRFADGGTVDDQDAQATLASLSPGGLRFVDSGMDKGDRDDAVATRAHLPTMGALAQYGRQRLAGIVDPMVSGATFPHDVMTGEADPSDTGRTLDLAGLAMTGGIGGAAAGPGEMVLGSGPLRRAAPAVVGRADPALEVLRGAAGQVGLKDAEKMKPNGISPVFEHTPEAYGRTTTRVPQVGRTAEIPTLPDSATFPKNDRMRPLIDQREELAQSIAHDLQHNPNDAVEHFYHTGPMYKAAERVGLSPAAADEAMHGIASTTAGTSPRTEVEQNVRNGSLLRWKNKEGMSFDSDVLGLGSGQNDKGYPMMAMHKDLTNRFLDGTADINTNPKPSIFRDNLRGDLVDPTNDTHNIRSVLMKYDQLNPGQLPKEWFKKGSYEKYQKTGKFDPWSDLDDSLATKADKGVSRQVEYGPISSVTRRTGEILGQPSAPTQSRMWFGYGANTNLASAAKTFPRQVDDRINVTAQHLGMAPDEVYKLMLAGKIPLMAKGGRVRGGLQSVA